MPGLFIVPLVLLCLPFRRYQVEFQWRWSLWLALVILVIFSVAYCEFNISADIKSSYRYAKRVARNEMDVANIFMRDAR